MSRSTVAIPNLRNRPPVDACHDNTGVSASLIDSSQHPLPRPASDCGGVAARSHQPNVPGQGIVASYGLRFWMLVVLVGLGAGLGGAALMELLRLIEHVAWSYHSGTFLAAVQRSSDTRRVLVLTVGGAVAGGGSILLGSRGGGEVSEAL